MKKLIIYFFKVKTKIKKRHLKNLCKKKYADNFIFKNLALIEKQEIDVLIKKL